MYTPVNVSLALYVCLIWVIIWRHSFLIDKARLEEGKKTGVKRVALPVDKRLLIYSGSLIGLLCIFYTVSYNGLDISLKIFDISQVRQFLGLIPIRIFLMALILVGARIIMKARAKLSMLTSKEVIFSLNNHESSEQANDGVYKWMHHPMYVGITIICLASLLLFPSILGAFLLVGVFFCLYMKVQIEDMPTK